MSNNMNEDTAVKRNRGGQLGHVTHKTAKKLALQLAIKTMCDETIAIDTRIRAASIILDKNTGVQK